MSSPNQSSPRGETADLSDEKLLDDPLAQILEVHLRQREICAKIDVIAGAETPVPADVSEVLVHMRRVLPVHVQDEEEDLFPMLRSRSEPGDEINATLDELSDEHGSSWGEAKHAETILARLAAEGGVPDRDEAAALIEYAAHERKHLIVENAIVLPLARGLLTADDIATLSANMRKRRSNRDAV
ncbi:MAG TPA: hemerythrin domain-containing protein [Paracoccaceae bacterium]|nr:hemerythrin domain-containing protein [Paracoccaceae bacterium]